MKKFYISALALTSLALSVAGCKPKTGTDALPEALTQPLQTEKNFANLMTDSCLLEIKNNFKEGSTVSIGTSSAPQCIPSKNVKLRGRLDVEATSTAVKPVSIALLVDNSVSLKTTDPKNQRFPAIDAFLKHLDGLFADNPNMLRLQVLFFSYCGIKRFRLSDYKTVAALRQAIGSEISKTPSGATNYLDALSQTRSWIEMAPESEAHVVLFSDGMPFALNGQVSSSCKLTAGDVDGLSLDSNEIAGCNTSFAPGSCREPSGSDTGFASKSNAAWDDPTNYAIGMYGHSKAFQDFSKVSQVKKIHTVYLNGGCYEENAANNQGDSNRARAFKHLCNTMAPSFFSRIATGENFEIRDVEDLQNALVDVSETIVSQVGFQKIEASVDGMKIQAAPYTQGGEAQAFNFETKVATLKNESGKFEINAYESTHSTNSRNFVVNYAFSFDGNKCSDFTTSADNSIPKTLLVSADKGNYKVTCRIPAPPEGCVTQSGVKVASGFKETVPGYTASSVQFGQTCENVALPRSRVCQDGAWSPWQGGQYTTCTTNGPANCGTHKHGSEWYANEVRYEKSVVPTGQVCKGERDKFRCDNGKVTTLFKTSYTQTSCNVEAHKNCGTVPHGGFENQACYNVGSVMLPQRCVPFFRKCVEGKFEPASCNYRNCVENETNCRDAYGNEFTSGSQQTRVRYRFATVPFGSTCESEVQNRLCSNSAWRDWSGTFVYESCQVLPEQSTPIPIPTPESEVTGEILAQ